MTILDGGLAHSDSAAAQGKTLIVPDKDADGLSSAAIVYKTLVLLGLHPSLIEIHFLSKHATVHDEGERDKMTGKNPKFVIVLDHGSRKAPPVVSDQGAKVLIMDHHLSDEFPEGSEVCQLSGLVRACTDIFRWCLLATIHPSLQPRYSRMRSASPFIRRSLRNWALCAQWVPMEIWEIL